MQHHIARLVEAEIRTEMTKQSSGSRIFDLGPPPDVKRLTSNTNGNSPTQQ